ncbi:MAG: hypothetical protein RI983_1213 [Bacteroidota bacterium]|jgi:YhcH/YjgK/YiaL family protein
MIVDSVAQMIKYQKLHPRFEKAMSYIAACKIDEMPVGETQWEGENIRAIVIQESLVSEKESTDYFECHNRYIDIQMVFEGMEKVGWKSRNNCMNPRGEYSLEKDVLFYDDSPEIFFNLKAGHFAIYFPEDVHAPMIGNGIIRKMVVKVLV